MLKMLGTVAATLVTVPAPAGVAQEPSPRQNVDALADVPLFKLVTGRLPVTPVDRGKPVALVSVTDVGVPRIGVTKVGEVANTAEPVPVSSVKAASKFAELNEPRDVAFQTEVIAPVRLALVVTLPAVRPAAVPVIFVPTNALGVPNAGVTSVGLVAKTFAPLPVSSVKAVAS